MAAEAYRVEPTPMNQKLLKLARKVVDRAIEDVT